MVINGTRMWFVEWMHSVVLYDDSTDIDLDRCVMRRRHAFPVRQFAKLFLSAQSCEGNQYSFGRCHAREEAQQ